MSFNNMNPTGYRVTHIPTGITVECNGYRTYNENREKAMSLLRAKLYAYQHVEPQLHNLQIEHGDGSYLRWSGSDLINAMNSELKGE